jgi:peptidoglycan hydrolase-like protein with peptidoglycan-binding domain
LSVGCDHPRKSRIIQDEQIALINAGYYNGPVDGKSSYALRRALKHFQKANRLVASGELDKKTRIKLEIF